MKTHSLLVLTTTALMACSNAPEPAQQTDNVDEQSAAAYLVWIDGEGGEVLEEGDPRTVVIDANGVVRADVPGHHVAANGRIYGLSAEPMLYEGGECEYVDQEGERSVELPILADLSYAGEHIYFGTQQILELTEDPSLIHVGAEATLLGSVGSVVFAKVCIDYMACGAAHPNYSCHLEAVDIETGLELQLDELAADPASAEEVVTDFNYVYPELEIGADDYTGVVAAYPIFDGPNLGFVHVHAASTCYACTGADPDGWGAYSVSLTVYDAELPQYLAARMTTMPDVVARWDEDNTYSLVGGISELSTEMLEGTAFNALVGE